MPAPEPYQPEPYVEIAWGFDPYSTPALGWVDITGDVREIHTVRGRDNELDTYAPGEMTITLDNFERQYDPLNTTGPNFGDLVSGVPIRLRAETSAGVFQDIFYGYVEAWPASYGEGGFLKEIEIKAYDITKYLAERSAPDTMYEDIMTTNGLGAIRRWYRFDRVRGGEQVIADVMGSGSTDLHVFAKWDGQERCTRASRYDALGIGQHKAPENTDNIFKGAETFIGPFDNSPLRSDQWAVVIVFRVTDIGQMGGYSVPLVQIMTPPTPGGTSSIFGISLHHGGQHHPSASVCPGCISAGFDTSGPGLGVVTGPGGVNDLTGDSPLHPGTFNPFDGQAHTVLMQRSAFTMELWADGVLVGTDSNGASTGLPPWNVSNIMRVYWPFQGVPAAVGRTFPGVALQDLIFFDNINPGAFDPVEVHESLMVGMRSVVTSGVATRTLSNRIGWDPLRTAIDDGEVQVVTPENPYGTSILELMQNYADCEDGRLFVSRDGKLTFHAGNRFMTQATETTVQYTFDDTTATSVGISGELRVAVDDRLVYEAAEVSREEGTGQYASTTATPKRTYSLTGLKLTSDLQALRRAEKVVFLHSTQVPRTEAWEVWPEVDATDWPTLLQLDIGHRVRVIVTPGGVGSQIDLQQHLELIEHHITATDWTMVLNGSPVDNTVYFVWGGTAAQGWGNGAWR